MSVGAYANITSNATTTLLKSACMLKRIVVNNPGTTWVATIYDDISAVAAHKVGTVAIVAGTLFYDVALSNGLTIVTTGTAGDLTVVYG